MSSIPPPNPFAPPGRTTPPPPAAQGDPGAPTTPQASRRELMAELKASRSRAGWSLVLAIVPLGLSWIASLVLALRVLCGPRDGLRRGRGMAWSALVVMVVWSGVAVVLALILLDARGIERNSDGEVISGGQVAPTELRIGDCLDETYGDEVIESRTVTVTPCGDLHHSQVIAISELEAGPYPGLDEAFALGEQLCLAEFQPWVGTPYESSNLLLALHVPTEDAWSEDRSVQCVAVSDDEVVGTFRGSNS